MNPRSWPGKNVDESTFQHLCNLARQRKLPVWQTRKEFDRFRNKWRTLRNKQYDSLPVKPQVIRQITGENCLRQALPQAIAFYMVTRYLLESLTVDQLQTADLFGGQLQTEDLRAFLGRKTPKISLRCRSTERSKAWTLRHGNVVGQQVPCP